MWGNLWGPLMEIKVGNKDSKYYIYCIDKYNRCWYWRTCSSQDHPEGGTWHINSPTMYDSEWDMQQDNYGMPNTERPTDRMVEKYERHFRNCENGCTCCSAYI